MKVTFLYILASVGGIFLKTHDFHFTSFRYKQRKFCCDSSVIIVTFLEEQCAHLSDSPLPGNRLS